MFNQIRDLFAKPGAREFAATGPGDSASMSKADGVKNVKVTG
jgi:hypothetical protein